MTLPKACLVIAYAILLCFVSHNEAKRKGDRQKNRASNGDNGQCELEVTCRGESPLPVKLPIQGPKGDSGDRGLRGEKGPKGDQGEQGMPADWKTKIFRILGLPMPEATKVAFFVGLKNNLGSMSRNEPIAFSELVTNEGDAYDVTTGYFTAPSNGTYYFNVVVAAVGRQKVRCHSNGTCGGGTREEWPDDSDGVGGEYPILEYSLVRRTTTPLPGRPDLAGETSEGALSSRLHVFIILGLHLVRRLIGCQ